MAVATSCSTCHRNLLASPDGRMPPWCPHCGANIKVEAEADPLPPAAATAPLGRAGLLPTVDAAPTESFFHACAPGFSENHHRLYRVYITECDLLIFALGVGAVGMGEVMARTRSTLPPQAGLAGAMAMMHESKQLALAKRISELDIADEATLREYTAAGREDAFRVAPEDVKWMTLTGPSLWNRWVCSIEHEAVWKFAHRKQGRWALALPSLRDARRAVEWLPRIFQDLIQVNLSWVTSGGAN